MPPELAWLIFLLPVASFAIIALLVRPFVKKESRVAGYITILARGRRARPGPVEPGDSDGRVRA